MAGHYPGQYGPPFGPPAPGGAFPKPVGPYGVTGKVLCCLAPLLTVGLLGMVPSLLLAVRRRRVFDVLGAVVVGGLFACFLISVTLAGGTKNPNGADTVGTVTMVLLWFATPLHFLVMDRRSVWGVGARRGPASFGPPVLPVQSAQPAWYTANVPTATAMPAMPAPPSAPDAFPLLGRYEAPQAFASPPGSASLPGSVSPPSAAPAFPAPAPRPAATNPGDDLQKLGELLRRQAEQGRP